MNGFLKNKEIIFFILINIFFASSFLVIMSFFAVGFIFVMLASIINKSLDFAENVGYYAVSVVWNLYIIAKIILFPILYNADKKFPRIHKFFDLFYAKKIIHRSILIVTFLLPFFVRIIFAGFDGFKDFLITGIFNELIIGYGVFPSYLIMYFYLKHKNSQKV